jgi:osmotically-inducible protein OsmY
MRGGSRRATLPQMAAADSVFRPDVDVNGYHISIASSSGKVTIEGVVGSWAEHDAAVAAVAAAPGVTYVEDRLVVEY